MSFAIYCRVRYVGSVVFQEQVRRGDIGYILEDHGDGNYEVEFSRSDGTTKWWGAIAESDLELADE